MTDRDIATLVARLHLMWPSWRAPATGDDMRALIAVWLPLLADLDPGLVDDAVRLLAAEGREWVPPPGVIRATVLDIADPVPTAEAAAAEIGRAIRTGGRTAQFDWSHPLVGDTVRDLGWWNLCDLSADACGRLVRGRYGEIRAGFLRARNTIGVEIPQRMLAKANSTC